MYRNQSLCVKWGNHISEDFTVSNGVKQGGILSPVLFTVYMDTLYINLKNSRLGCYVGHLFLGALGYADDGVLLCPTINAMRLMLNICDKFGNEFDVLYNPNKYQLVHYSKNYDVHLDFNFFRYKNIDIEVKKQAIHLGHLVGPKSNKHVINRGIDNFLTAFNGVHSCFNKADCNVKYKLFKSFCMPLYGSIFWDYSSKYISKFYVTWRKCIRKLLNIPNLTHSKLINLIVDDIPIEIQLYKRFMKFLYKAYNSNNNNISFCTKLMLNGSNSVINNNLTHICNFLNINRCQLLISCSYSQCNLLFKNKVSLLTKEDDKVTSGNIRDLLFLRDSKVSNFTYDELNTMITYLCI